MNNKKIFIDSGIYFLGSILAAVLGFVVSLVYSYYFDPSDYGNHSLVSSTYMLLSQFFGIWLSTGLLRFYEKYKNINRSDELLTSIYGIQFIISLVFVIIFNIGNFFVSNNHLLQIILVIYSLVFYFEYNILITNTTLRCTKKVKKYNINIVLNNFLKVFVVLFIIFVLNFKSIVAISLSILLSELIQYLLFLFSYKLYKYFNFKLFRFEIVKELFMYGFPLIGTTITGWILNVSDRYIIRLLRDSKEVGLYSYSYLLGNNLFWLLANFIMLGAYPNFVECFEKGNITTLKELFKKYINLYLLIIIPCCFGVIGVSKLFFSIFTASQYHEGYIVFIITGCGISFLGLCQFLNKVFELYKNTKTIFILNVCTSIFNILFNFIFINYWGYIGGAISTLMSYVLYFIIALVISKKYIELDWDCISIFKFLLSGLLMLSFITLFLHFINLNNDILQLIICLIIGIVSYFTFLLLFKGIKKESITEIIKLVRH